MLEYVVGTETHSSNWGKFYVKGLEKWEVKEDQETNVRDSHHNYQLKMDDVQTDTECTMFKQSGNKGGTEKVRLIRCSKKS